MKQRGRQWIQTEEECAIDTALGEYDKGKRTLEGARRSAWNQYVIAMNLRPEKNAEQIYQEFDRMYEFLYKNPVAAAKAAKAKPVWVKVTTVTKVESVDPMDLKSHRAIYFWVNAATGSYKYTVKGSAADDIHDLFDVKNLISRGLIGAERKQEINRELNLAAQKVIDKLAGKAYTPKIAAPKPKPTAKPPRTPAPTPLAVPMGLGGGGIPPIPGVEPTAAPKPVKRRQPAAKPAKAPKPKKKAAKPAKAKNGKKPAPKLTAKQRKHLNETGSVMVRRGGKFIQITR